MRNAFARYDHVAGYSITASIFHMINSLAVDAIDGGCEHITDEAVENWEPEFDTEAAFV